MQNLKGLEHTGFQIRNPFCYQISFILFPAVIPGHPGNSSSSISVILAIVPIEYIKVKLKSFGDFEISSCFMTGQDEGIFRLIFFSAINPNNWIILLPYGFFPARINLRVI